MEGCWRYHCVTRVPWRQRGELVEWCHGVVGDATAYRITMYIAADLSLLTTVATDDPGIHAMVMLAWR